MSWFGGGDKKEQEKSFVATDSSAFDGGAPLDLGPAGGGGGGAAAMAEFQQASMALQQQLLVQSVITDLADRAFVKCTTGNKDSKLTSREVSCIQACTNKWLDANEYMARRLTKKGEQMMQQQQGGFS